MYLSLQWLKDFVDIPKNINPEKLGNKFTIHTVEIDSVESQEDKFKKIVIGKILEIKKHPKADKLQLAIVDVKNEKLNIVCGAPNILVGQMVPVALVGAILQNGIEIKPAVIRGEESHGMLCAEDELGLGNDHSGIMQLETSAKIGSSLCDYLGFDDVIFEVDNKSITNRPDLWGHYGMAREIAAFLNTKLLKDLSILKKGSIEIEDKKIDLKVKIDDKSVCKRYMAVSIDNIKVKKSPRWMRTRLIAAGIRPINNIVDITNYVMLEIGQPMHAFDTAKIASDKKAKKVRITAGQAKTNEKIKSLDGEIRNLCSEDLIISNEKEIIAIAGLMGGEESEIDEQTRSIILESANFNSSIIRRTSQRLGLRTEASQRFEKSLDPSICEQAIVRAIKLIKQVCPSAIVSSKIVDEGNFSYKKKGMSLELAWLEKFLGKKISEKEIIIILEKLGFEPKIIEDVLNIEIPSWRAKDIRIKEDVVEEIIRIYGYNKIEAKMPKIFMQLPFEDLERKLMNEIRVILSFSLAMSEVYNYSFVGDDQLKAIGIDSSSYIRIANPITQNHTILRQNLATNLIDNVKRNQARFSDIKIFEMGNVYLPIESNLKKSDYNEETLPLQEKRLGILFSSDSIESYMNLKSAVTRLFLGLCQDEVSFGSREKMLHWSNEDYVTEIKLGEIVVGAINVLDTQIARKNNIKKEVVIAELYLSEVLDILKNKNITTYRPFEKFPPLVRDLAFVLDESIAYNSIKDEIKIFHQFINKVELFDEFHGDRLGKGKKSLAFRITYQAEKTLHSKEVDEIQDKLFKHLEQKFEAKIRNF